MTWDQACEGHEIGLLLRVSVCFSNVPLEFLMNWHSEDHLPAHPPPGSAGEGLE